MAIQKLYPLSEAAPMVGMTLNTLRQYVSNGIVPALYIGRKRVIKASVIEKICEEGLTTKKEEQVPA